MFVLTRNYNLKIDCPKIKNKLKIISTIRHVKLSVFVKLTGVSEFKLKKIKESNSNPEGLILITAPDGNLFVNLCLYHNWCISTQTDSTIEYISSGVAFITAELYAELSGYTIKAIKRKVENKIWYAPIAFRAPNGELLININSVEKWIISQYLKEAK